MISSLISKILSWPSGDFKDLKSVGVKISENGSRIVVEWKINNQPPQNGALVCETHVLTQGTTPMKSHRVPHRCTHTGYYTHVLTQGTTPIY